jgi:hypothetical protein
MGFSPSGFLTQESKENFSFLPHVKEYSKDFGGYPVA